MGGIYDLKKAFKAAAPTIDLRGVTMRYRRNEETGKDEEVYEFRYVENGQEKVAEEIVGPQETPVEATVRAAQIARGAADRIVCRREDLPGPAQPETLAERVGLSVPQPLFDDNFEADKVFDADKVTYPAAEGGPEDATPFLSRVMGGSKTTKEET